MFPQVRWRCGIELARVALVLGAGFAATLPARSAQAQYPVLVYTPNPSLPGPSSVEIINQAMIDRLASVPESAIQAANARAYQQMRAPQLRGRTRVATQRRRSPSVPVPVQVPVPVPAAPTSPGMPEVPEIPQVSPLPIAVFFSASDHLLWPAEAPDVGELRSKQLACEAACRTVKALVNQQGIAPLATVEEARTKLLDYGRPALDYVRKHAPEPTAEGFHFYLLELYGSLAEATNPQPRKRR